MAALNAMLQAAIWYAESGYPVFPCAAGRKTPLTPHGLLDATTDVEQITRWWTQHPEANVAIRTDGLVVIDIDGPDNPWLTDRLPQLTELGLAPTSLTPRGGRQHVFRQPEGKHWRNTAAQLAPNVDTRADGGYIVVAPSVVNGKTYQWSADYELATSPQRLPEPPVWLAEMLDAPPSSPTPETPAAGSTNAIPQGQRNATLARLAGSMRRVGMSQAEILAALLRVSIDRCHPPLPQREVERIAGSIARYEPDAVSVAVAEDHWNQQFALPPVAGPLSVRELLASYRLLHPPIIHGLLRRGETMNVIAPSKTGKSWLVLALAMAVATGRPWLDSFRTEQGNVLILDNELHLPTLAHRIPKVAEALGIRLDEIAESLHVHSLRGQLRDIFALGDLFQALQPGRFSLIVLDAFYRFMPRAMDENDNGTMANIYNAIDALAERLGTAFVLIHHSSKGNQSGKAVTDVGAGAGSQSRATDSHAVMRPHEEPGAVVMEAAVRSWPPVEPMVLRWQFPVWRPAHDLDPALLRSERAGRRKDEPKPEALAVPGWTVEQFVETFISEAPKTKPEIREATQDQPGLSWRRVSDLLDVAESRGLIYRWSAGRSHRVLYATVPPPATEEVNP